MGHHNDYDKVDTYTLSHENRADVHVSKKYFFRQLLVCSVIWVSFFVYGLCLGAPTVFIPQIRKQGNATEAVSQEMASWLTAIYGYGGIPWVIILPISAAYLGRKIPYVFVNINALSAFIFFYLSINVTQILISEAMESVIGASLTTLSILVITEYTSPRYRGIFLTFKSATLFWGIWVSNAMGTFFHWKYIGLLKLTLSIYPLLVILFWPESPYWLANKGKFDKCAESHRWLKGCNNEAEKELDKLIKLHQQPAQRSNNFKVIFCKEFYKSTLLCFCVFGLYSFSGKMTCGFYSLDIIKKMTSSESSAYFGMLILDGLSVLGMYIGTFMSKYFRRRPFFLIASSVGVISLFILALYTYLIYLLILTENFYVSILLLSVYSIGISCGPMIMSTSLYGELLPLKFRSFAMCLVAIFDKFLMGTITKLAPYVMKNFGLHCAFLFFGITSAISICLLSKYMPETKDKTLIEIANEMKGNANNSDEENELNEKICSH